MVLFVLYIHVVLGITHITSSNIVAYQTVTSYTGHWECVSRTWWWCSRHRWISHPIYGIRYKCAPGYGGSSCSPICQPTCKQGTCASPGYCRCPPAYQGKDCGKIQTCSFRKPCFPGVCGYNDQCQCANGFKSGESDEEGCLFFEDSQKPKVTRCTTKLINLERSTQKEQYRYVADSSSPNISEPDVMWSNQKDFNFINIYFEGQYESPEIVTTPDYIRYYKFGVTRGSVKIEHTKIPRRGKPPPDIKPLSLPCENSPGTKNPETETFKCNITRSDYTTSFESGDNLTVSVFIYNGGYRNIIQPHNIDTQDYIGQYQKKSMIFKFDFGKPYYSTTAANQTLFLYVSEEITKISTMKIQNISTWSRKPDEL